VFHAAGAPIAWDEQYVAKEVDPRTNSFVTRENLDSVLVRDRPPAPPLRHLSPTHVCTSPALLVVTTESVMLTLIVLRAQKHKIGLKAPMTTPIGKGFRSLNLTLRKVCRSPHCFP